MRTWVFERIPRLGGEIDAVGAAQRNALHVLDALVTEVREHAVDAFQLEEEEELFAQVDGVRPQQICVLRAERVGVHLQCYGSVMVHVMDCCVSVLVKPCAAVRATRGMGPSPAAKVDRAI